MRLTTAICLILLPLALGGCASRSQQPVMAAGEDDDAFCRAGNVAVGSKDYVACRRDRDVARSNAANRADRAQRNIGEHMLNNPAVPN